MLCPRVCKFKAKSFTAQAHGSQSFFLIIIAPHRLRPTVEFLEQASVRPFYRCINFNSLANRQRLFHIELNPQMFGYSTQ
jgi:hypothetical protein